MDLLEYQGKQLFAQHGVPVPDGRPAEDVDAAVAAADEVGYPCVIKAQVGIGGRGKAGGIKVAESRADAKRHAEAILGMEIRGPRGEGPFTVHEVWVERASEIDAEYYASIILDRSAKKQLTMLSTMGGMNVEEIAEKDPHALVKRYVEPSDGFDAKRAAELAADAGLEEDVVAGVGEAMAKERGLTYVKLDGSVGILGNGAGLCMSTLDVVAQAGGSPANFLDAGGGSKAEAIVDALEVITSDEKVTALLFNIFGGITRCDEIARGIIGAYERIDIEVPVVVRLDGTNSEEGLGLLADADLPNLHVEKTMLGAAERVVELA